MHYRIPIKPNFALTLRELLLDEEISQIAQLPRTGQTQHGALNECPSHHSRIHALALISELGLALSLENLLPSHVLQPRVQVLDFLHYLAQLFLVRALNLRCLADGHVQLELDIAD